MNNILSDSLHDALKAVGLREIPEELQPNSDKIWINAIVRVRKAPGILNYCLATNDGDGGVKITKDFGPCAIITGIDGIYPTESLGKRFKPDLRTDKQRISFLSKNGYDADEIAALLNKDAHETPESLESDRKKVMSYIYKVAIKLASQTLADEKKYKNIGKDFNSRFEK